MISKFSMTNISNNLADDRFIALCQELNTEIYTCLEEGFEGQRVGKERRERIKSGFAAAMLKRSEENGI